MKYIIDLPDNIRPIEMLDCDTDDAARMLMSARPYKDVILSNGSWAAGDNGLVYADGRVGQLLFRPGEIECPKKNQ